MAKKSVKKDSKYKDAFEDTHAIFTQELQNAGLINEVNLLILVDDRQKKIFKIKKADDVLKHRTDDDVIIFLNELVFEKLPNDIKVLVAIEAIAHISCNLDSGKVAINKPDFEAHTGVLNQHGYPRINVVRESVKTIYDQLKQEEDQKKAEEAAKKKAGRKAFA